MLLTLKYSNIDTDSNSAVTSSFALIQKALDITGAKISVTSKAGEGATFTVRLKLAEKG
ncbi:MAG: hypothetical protein LBG27_11460 [Spirochaetaceae bacterium]|nr:hypothetical protein [Spirochaetaceae bacterium]